MINLILGLVLGGIAQTICFVQLQGQFKWEWAKENTFLMACLGIPISILHIISVKYTVDYYDGELWPSRLMGFAISTIVFASMAYFWFHEAFDLKTTICTSLAVCILLIQIYWK
jgi:hypothetical protein